MQIEPETTRIKRQSVMRWIWILFQAGWGAALAVILVWGPFSLTGWPVWAAGLFGAVAVGVLWFRADRLNLSGAVIAARRMRRGLHLFNLVVILIAAVAVFHSLSTVGTFPPPSSERVENFERLWRAMDAAYPYFEQKGIDWDAVYEENAPRVAASASDGEYRQIVAEILLGLNDLHTRVNGDQPRMTCCFAITEEVEGQAVVVKAGAQATEAGLVPGSVVVSLDGQPAENRVQDYLNRWAFGSAQGRRDAFFYLFALYEDNDRISIDFVDPKGVERAAVLLLTNQAGADGGSNGTKSPLITADRLDSGIAVIRIPTFSDGSGHDLVAEFDRALDSAFDAPGLIIDLRGNGGGSTMLSDPMAGRLITEGFIYGREDFAYRLPQRLWRSHFDYRITPRPPVFTGPVAVITDRTIASTAENFLAALVDSGRAFTVGQKTAGGSGNPIHFQLPGGDCQFSTGDFRRLNGLSIEGVGFEPNVSVERTLDDIVQGRDPFMEVAENALLEKIR